MKRRLLLTIACCLGLATAAHAQLDSLKSPDFPRAIHHQFKQVPAGTEFALGVELNVEAPWHIYSNPPSDPNRKATKLTIKPPAGVQALSYIYPAGQMKSYGDGQAYRVYEGPVQIVVRLKVDGGARPGSLNLPAEIEYLACDDRGRCKTPTTYDFTIPIEIVAAGQAAVPTGWQPVEAGPAQPDSQTTSPSASAGQVDIQGWIRERGLFLTLGLVFLAGLAINLTPCVFPLIPVTIGFFGMQSHGDRRRTFLLACAYVLGMVGMYSSLGVIAALAGRTFGFATQSPWVNAAIGAMIGVLALSMFGLYEIQPPAFMTGKAQSRSGVIGALFMGLIVGVAAAPCSGPVVLGLMAFTSTTGSVALGLTMFVTLALGLGLPFLILGMFTGLANALPRSGAWMETTKRVFGVLMLFAALYFARSLLPKAVFEVLAAAYWLGAGMYLIFGDHELASFLGAKRFKGALGLAACVWGVYALTMTGLRFDQRPVSWPAVTEAGLAEARAVGRPVVLDFRTANCAACDKLEERTFSDARVQERIREFAAFQADVSDREDLAAKLAREHGVNGFPNIIFFAPDGREIGDLRLTEFEPPDKFLRRLERFAAQLPPARAAADRATRP